MKFSREGLKARLKMDEDGDVVSNAFVVSVAPDVPVGIHKVRVGGGKFGASNYRSFVVSDLPEVAAGTGNRMRENACEVVLGSTVYGKAVAGSYSWFRFSAEKGQRILGECEVDDIDTKFLPSLALFDPEGLEVLSVPQGNVLDYLVPAAGEWYVRLSDFLYKGGNDYVYRLTLSTRPYVDLVYPPVGKPGTSGEYTLLGRNLPGGRPSRWKTRDGKILEQKTVKITLPGRDSSLAFGSSSHSDLRSGLLDHFEYREKSPAGISNPVYLAYASDLIIYEKEEVGKLSHEEQRIPLPCAFVGKFFPYADKDRLRFTAKKGEVLHMEVFSERLGCSSHVLMLVERLIKKDDGTEAFSEVGRSVEAGALLGEDFFNPSTREPSQVFDMSTRDPSYRLEVPEDGEYRVLLYDLFNGGVPNPLNVYCLCIRKVHPGYHLSSYNLLPPKVIDYKWAAYVKSPTIRKGEVFPVRVMVLRKDGFDGPIDLELTGLPPKVSYFPKRISPRANSVVVIIQPGPDAADWDGSFSIMGKARVEERVVLRRARHADVSWSTATNSFELPFVRAHLLDSAPLSVVGRENVPVKLSFDDAKLVENARKAYEFALKNSQEAEKEVAVVRSKEKDLDAVWKKAAEVLVAAREKLTRGDKKSDKSIKSLTKATDSKKEAVTKAKKELILAEAKRTATKEELEHRKDELSTAEKHKANPAADDVRVIETAVGGIVKLPVRLKLADSCKPTAKITVCGHQAVWGRSGNMVKEVNLDLKKKTEASVELNLTKVKLPEGEFPLFFTVSVSGKYKVYSDEDAKEAESATKRFDARVKVARQTLMESKKALSEMKKKLEEAKKAKDVNLVVGTAKALLIAENEMKNLEGKVKRLEVKEKKAAGLAKKIRDGSKKPRDYSADLYVTPFLLKVREAPIEIKPLKKRSLRVGEKLDLPVVIRRYGDFADPVSLKVVLPDEAKGFSINSKNVEKGMYAAIIEIAASAEASPANSLECMLEATFKFNNQPIKVSEPFILKIDPALGKLSG